MTTNVSDQYRASQAAGGVGSQRKCWHRDVLRETTTSAFANTLFSLAFTLLVFHGRRGIPIFGPGGLERDALPQCFMVGLMSALIAPLVIRGRIVGRKLSYDLAPRFARISRLYLRAAAFAIAAMIVGVALQVVLLAAIFRLDLDFRQALAFKALFGAALALCVTPGAILSSYRLR